jgi:hypothetical protein
MARLAVLLLGVIVVLGALVVVIAIRSRGTFSQVAIDRVRVQGVAPDLIYVVDLPGYEIAEQSVGVIGEEGFGAFYVSPDGRRVQLRVDRGTFSDAECATTPVADAEPAAALVECDHDEVGWYRQAGGRHEYLAVREDALIRLNGQLGAAGRAALKAAMAGARQVQPTGNQAPTPSPVERGDLPTNGDRAPNNQVGPGG